MKESKLTNVLRAGCEYLREEAGKPGRAILIILERIYGQVRIGYTEIKSGSGSNWKTEATAFIQRLDVDDAAGSQDIFRVFDMCSWVKRMSSLHLQNDARTFGNVLPYKA